MKVEELKKKVDRAERHLQDMFWWGTMLDYGSALENYERLKAALEEAEKEENK